MEAKLKKCTRCDDFKDITFFFNKKTARDGKDYYCKKCRRDIKRIDYHKFPERRRAALDSYKKNNPEKVKQWRKTEQRNHKERYRFASKKWVKNNPEKRKASIKKSKLKCRPQMREYEKRQWATNPKFRLAHNLRLRMRLALKGKTKWHLKYTGCSVEELRSYLESRFRDGMTWENHGSVWEIDHVMPLCKFDLSNLDQVLKASHFTNLQPLLILEHKAKTKQDME